MAEQVNIDLSDSARSPGLLPTGTPTAKRSPFGLPGLPASTRAIFDQLRARSKQALPAAPAAVPPVAPKPWLKYGLIGLAVVGGVAVLSRGRKKGRKRHG